MSQHPIVMAGVGAVIVLGLAMVVGLVVPPWGDANRGPASKLNLGEPMLVEYDRTKMSLVGNSGELDPSWQPDVNSSSGEGYVAYVASGCASCHGLNGQGGTVAGPVTGLNSDVVRFFVRTGPGGMPAYVEGELPQEQLGEIIAWLGDQSPSVVEIPSVPHALEGRSDCLLCHDSGGIRPFPADHVGRGTEICLVCHEAKGKPVGVPTPTPQTTPTPALTPSPLPLTPITTPEGTPAATSTPTPTPQSGEEPPLIPHTLEGRSDCLLCHNSGGIVPFPTDHVGRGNEICLLCHQAKKRPAAVPTPTPEAIPTSTPTGTPQGTPTLTPTSTPAPTPTVAPPTPTPTLAEAPPPVPHTLEGRTECLLCHDSGGIVPFPKDHVGRTNDICLLCHRGGS